MNKKKIDCDSEDQVCKSIPTIQAYYKQKCGDIPIKKIELQQDCMKLKISLEKEKLRCIELFSKRGGCSHFQKKTKK